MKVQKRSQRMLALVLTAMLVLVAACSGAKKADNGLGNNSKVKAGESTDQGTTDTSVAPDGTVTDAAGNVVQNGTNGVAAGGTASGTGTKSGSSTAAGGGGSAGGSGGTAGAATTLFSDKENTIGITKDKIVLCAHAALTYAPAFHTNPGDLDVYFRAINAEQNGIFGRKVEITYENDDYKPDTAVQAATTCKTRNPFMLLGGIGFDQIPAVRNWAEQNHMLYIHHTATENGLAGKQYSFTELPSVEKTGELFGELAATRFKGKKIGIIKRDSPNWEPGVKAFKEYGSKHGVKVVAERAVAASKGNYVEDLLAMQNAGAEVVFAWENALAQAEMIKQAKGQQYSPSWMVFPFNLTSQTLGDDALNPKLVGIAMFAAYSNGDYSGPFAAYADDMKEFEAQYKKYDPDADIKGVAGDLLFLNWTAMKALHKQLLDCGPDCTRNKFIDVLKNYKKRPSSSSCDIDFTRELTHLGGYALNVMETYRSPDGHVNWRHTDTCVEHL